MSGIVCFPLIRGTKEVCILPLLRGGEVGVDCIELENIIRDIWINLSFWEKYNF